MRVNKLESIDKLKGSRNSKPPPSNFIKKLIS